MIQALRRILALLGFDLVYRYQRPYDPPPRFGSDPYAWRPVPRMPKPSPRASAVAVAEPDE